MQRLAVISRENASSLSTTEVIAALVKAAFPSPAQSSSTPTPSTGGANPLTDAVRSQIAEHLMSLAADNSATPEVQAAALAGIYNVQKIVRADQSPSGRRLDRQINLFLTSPHDNTPRPRPSGAPPGPPV